jgi:hypothetical protein
LTVYGMLRALFALRYRGFLGVLYLFPSRDDVADFSRARVKNLIAENPDTIGRWLADTDSVGLKKVGGGHLYLRGMVSRVGLKSVQADLVCFDELDEARDQSAVDMAIERMGHSEFIGDGRQLGNSRTMVEHARRAATQIRSMLDDRTSGAGLYPSSLTPENQQRLKSEAQSIFRRALMDGRSEFVKRSRRALPGWFSE